MRYGIFDADAQHAIFIQLYHFRFSVPLAHAVAQHNREPVPVALGHALAQRLLKCFNV